MKNILELILVIAAFPGFWLGSLYVASRFGGWSSLAERYSEDEYREGKTYHMRSGKFGAVSYGMCLNLTICESGIRVSIMLPFRFCHPPFFLPWTEIHSAREISEFFTPFLKAQIGHPPIASVNFPIWIRNYLPEQSFAEAGD